MANMTFESWKMGALKKYTVQIVSWGDNALKTQSLRIGGML
uniref:Uncharacterized protein n=1 Tax=Anguilla anguilla TaxID=7936 RepID=A0A0E9Q3Y2_ANGAN